MDKQTPEDKLAELQRLSDEQDANHEAKIAKITGDTATTIDETDADRLRLLDRIEKRMPDLDLDQHEVGWTRLEDGNEALLIDGGGIDGGTGYFIANSPVGDDLHIVGPTTPFVPGAIAALAVHPDGSRELVKLIPDPLADWRRDDVDED